MVLVIGMLLGASTGILVYSESSGGRAITRAGAVEDSSSLQSGYVPPGNSSQIALTGGTDTVALQSFVSEIYKEVSPAVVYITTETLTFDFFLNPTITPNAGSGFIVDERGYILTNSHVVQNARSIKVVLSDGEEVPAKLVGADAGTDIALLKIKPPEGKPLPVARLGSVKDLQVGDWVVAIGNPYGLDRTVTFGVVSALGRTIIAPNQQRINNVIQTDAAINPGNSGGPLINARGEVVGINSAILTQSGGSEGIGLAIPIDTAKEIFEDLIKYGRVLRPWLGVEVRELTPRIARRIGLSFTEGLVITAVYEDSPTAKAGILPPIREGGQVKFYVVRKAKGKPVKTYSDLLTIVRESKTGEKITLELVHVVGGKEQVIEKQVTLETLPEIAPPTGII